MRFFKKMKKPSNRKKFAWLPIKVFGQYEVGYGQQGTVWLEFVLERTTDKGNKYYELI